jgi:hypothetical protein
VRNINERYENARITANSFQDKLRRDRIKVARMPRIAYGQPSRIMAIVINNIAAK